MLADYTQRMSNVLETPISADNNQAALPNFPQKRDRIIQIADIRQGLWEVLDFRQCDMLSIISERNSSLGKVMPASQKMRYELRFFHAMQLCRATLAAIPKPDETQQAFIARLEVLYQTKKTNLPAEIWNGIYGSKEISNHFNQGAEPLPLSQTPEGNSAANFARMLNKFAHLASLANPEQAAIELPDWLDDIEAEYAALHHSDFGAQLLATLPLLTNTLNQTAEAIDKRLARKPFCYEGHQPQRATVLGNVFQKYYVQQVQPYMALVEKAAKPWFEQHGLIMSHLPTTKAMQDYHHLVVSLQNPKSLWNRWIEARNRHTKSWQTILGQCNMMPRK